ncbi:MAG TPA: xanthine dehydrogenase family protein molybdopterin-binding subunit [Magnetospirillaceae bacterium]|jgi:xanthine dehydrogenase YagR molybdenum-binding subunit
MPEGSNPTRTGIGTAAPRIDGRLKVTGQAAYGSDAVLANPAHAYLVTSTIARGTIRDIDDTETRKVNGVLDILTYRNVGDRVQAGQFFSKGGYCGTSIQPLASNHVWHAGQIVAIVLADSFEAAREGAFRLTVTYDEQKPSAGFDAAGVEIKTGAEASKEHQDPKVGDAGTAYQSAPVKLDLRYSTPTQHHNPIELFTTACAWQGGKLTVWESSQNVYGFRFGLAQQLGLDPDDVHVISPFIGGAFGSRGSLTQRTALIAYAARLIGRPVKLDATRDQGFTIATYRAETRHRIRIAADRQGKLVSLNHEGWEVTSRADDYMVSGTDASTRLYACPNVSSNVSIVKADRSTPGFMRSPPEMPYIFALECAMDELAVALNMDPVELRRINDTRVEPIKGLRYTSRSLMQCFDEAAKAFGWQSRNPRPGSMRDGDWLIGWGCATSTYPSQIAPATARVILTPQGTVKVQTAAHEIGNGAYTAVALTAADRLGIELERITVELGDSDLPPAPVAGGSNTTASVCNVVAMACGQIRDRIATAAVTTKDAPFFGQDAKGLRLVAGSLQSTDGKSEPLADAMRRVANGAMEGYAENIPHGGKPDSLAKLYRGIQSLTGGAKMKDRIQFAYGAEFVELRINARTREIRCPRMVGAFAAGQIVNPLTAKSQLVGGLIWGLSSALHEATDIDRRAARFTNDDLAEYLIPVNADVDQVEVIMVPEEDHEINELGIKGLGELGNVGTAAAVLSAVYHATGIRLRDLPVRLEHILPGIAA